MIEMNLLQQYLVTAELNPIDAMNQLQNAGIISDNCVSVADVALGDAVNAVRWLRVEDVLWI